jgi:hypothetical protein
MQLALIHVLVLTAWHVAQYSAEEEDLFGMVCVLLCVAAATPPHPGSEDLLFRKVHVDTSLFEVESSCSAEDCVHEELWPSELTENLSASFPSQNCPLVRHGWSVFCEVLRQIEVQYHKVQPGQAAKEAYGEEIRIRTSESAEESFSEGLDRVFWEMPEEWSHDQWIHCEHREVEIRTAYGQNMILGHLRAVCQTELLTYRRRQPGARWTSPRISIDVIERYILSGNSSELPMVQERALLQYCLCGYSLGWVSTVAPRQDDACCGSYGSLEDGNCAAYVDDSEFDDRNF